MKVLVVNASDASGGAARAAQRLHQGLISAGVESRMLVQNKLTDEHTVDGPISRTQKLRGVACSILDELPLRRYKNRGQALFSSNWAPSGVSVDAINAQKPDIVHLHWINNGMIRIEDIARIEAPVVWSLHDMWAFTGGCHYDEHCGRFQSECGRCKVLASSVETDLSRKVLRRKKAMLSSKPDLAVVGLSHWLATQARRSALFRDRRVLNLPNPIDTEIFAPFDKDEARALLGLPKNRSLVLFGAMKATGDPRKGYKELSKALSRLRSNDCELVVFGSSRPTEPQEFPQSAHYMGRVYDDLTLRVLYSAADVMVVPSLQENLSNAIMESLACGTPVVCFDIGGNCDMVDHLTNGYLAREGDSSDLSEGIRWALSEKSGKNIELNAVEKIRSTFSMQKVIPQYLELYQQLLNEGSAGP